jgi:hypothetical protein
LAPLTCGPRGSCPSSSCCGCGSPTPIAAAGIRRRSVGRPRRARARARRIREQRSRSCRNALFFWPSAPSGRGGSYVAQAVRLTGDVLEKNASSEVLVEVEETVLWGLCDFSFTSPCCLKMSRWKRISMMVNHLAMGAQSLPRRVLFMKLKWLTV